ncbi:MAG: GNAT family N-acetyltransferase [Clostridiales bacterium]|nr:GNAT family N-acetyltransferase [Clostridiales bacterium]
MVAVIIETARFNNIIAVNIETEDNHRNKGLAFALTHYFVNECIDNGIIVQWDCMVSNIVLQRVSKKANFQYFKKDTVYWFEI